MTRCYLSFVAPGPPGATTIRRILPIDYDPDSPPVAVHLIVVKAFNRRKPPT
jgi:hypothetical protein